MNYEELYGQIRKKKSFLCVGLDTDCRLLPEHIKGEEFPMFAFNKAIVDSTAEYAVAYKPNLAFYEAEGASGLAQLEMTVDYIRSNYPGMFLIADAKRGDIGNTAKLYARAFFEKMDFDAVTLAPYMGSDSIAPFMEYDGKWSVILALTSNKSATDFESSILGSGEPLYEKIISTSMKWGSKDNTMYVVGATRPEHLAEIRKYCPDHFLLVPGVGAQGGTVEEVAEYGLNASCGLIINSSRGIIFADRTEKFASVAAEKAKELSSKMAPYIERLK